MNVFEKLMNDIKVPKMVPVEYQVEQGSITRDQIYPLLKKGLIETGVLDRLEPGKRVAVTCGSREICNIDEITRSMIRILKEAQMDPYIFAAMGSHGGAKVEGQLEILEGYGVTEETMGVPVTATMDTVVLGKTEKGLEVHFEKTADAADYVIPIGRIKAHTDFRGRIESGLMKMLAIGCGKQHGANLCHELGFPAMSENVIDLARVILQKKNVPFGVAIVEDAFHSTYLLEVIPGEKIEEREVELLKKAKSLIPSIPFEKADVLVLDEIGKDISGSGMDPTVTGRSGMLGKSKPFLERIVVLSLSEKSHHNGCGIGLADITTQRYFEDTDFFTSYPNGMTSHDPAAMRMPPVMPNDLCAIKMGIHSCLEHDRAFGHKVVWMKNTLCLKQFYISENMISLVDEVDGLSVVGDPFEIEFDENGNVPWLKKPRNRYGIHDESVDYQE